MMKEKERTWCQDVVVVVGDPVVSVLVTAAEKCPLFMLFSISPNHNHHPHREEISIIAGWHCLAIHTPDKRIA
jgi:hypothetical protein